MLFIVHMQEMLYVDVVYVHIRKFIPYICDRYGGLNE